MENETLEFIDCWIENLKKLHLEFQVEWESSSLYEKLNYKTKEVRDFEKIQDILFSYLKLLNFWVLRKEEQLAKDNRVQYRVKYPSSIIQKHNKYMNGKLQGRSPIKKCFNDIFGVRLILEEKQDLEKMLHCLQLKYKELKIIDGSKNGYKAVHIYFARNNFELPWELQIWNKCDEENNKYLHSQYKQGYVRWEMEFERRQ